MMFGGYRCIIKEEEDITFTSKTHDIPQSNNTRFQIFVKESNQILVSEHT
jgi:hypothetical protein